MQNQRLYSGFPPPPPPATIPKIEYGCNGRYSPSQYRNARHCMTSTGQFQAANFFPGIDETASNFLQVAQVARAEAALMDIKSAYLPTSMSMATQYSTGPDLHSFYSDPLGQMHPADTSAHFGYAPVMHPSSSSAIMPTQACLPTRYSTSSSLSSAVAAATGEPDTDPRQLEQFAEHFKQRRIKLGVTQADVGKALAHLKMPGVGSLSQSTICRFESLTLSHNNMVALKPILESWLTKAEDAAKGPLKGDGILPNQEKKRKRTSIAAPEKRTLEIHFAVQPRPSGERIAAIAEKLDLKKNVVRVWFCNQRQKQKRCRNQAGGARVPKNMNSVNY